MKHKLTGIICAVVIAIQGSLASGVFAQTGTTNQAEFEAMDSMTLKYTKWAGSDTVSKMKFSYEAPGLHHTIFVKEHTSLNLRRWGYLKFDIGSYTESGVSSAKLYIKSCGKVSSDQELQIYETTGEWSTETFQSVLNENPPAYHSVSLGSCAIPNGSEGSVYEIDLTGYIESLLAQGKTKVNLMLKMKDANDLSGVLFYSQTSKDAEDYTEEDPRENAMAPTLILIPPVTVESQDFITDPAYEGQMGFVVSLTPHTGGVFSDVFTEFTRTADGKKARIPVELGNIEYSGEMKIKYGVLLTEVEDSADPGFTVEHGYTFTPSVQ